MHTQSSHHALGKDYPENQITPHSGRTNAPTSTCYSTGPSPAQHRTAVQALGDAPTASPEGVWKSPQEAAQPGEDSRGSMQPTPPTKPRECPS